MKKILAVLGSMLAGLIIFAVPVLAKGGFDEFGYNRTARNFVGTCKSWHMGKFGSTAEQAEAYCGIYSNDKLVMKWNAEWDRGNDEGWTDPDGYDAWLNNEWNGMGPGGSDETWHYMIAWDSGCASDGIPSSEALKGTAYCIWGPFAMLQSHGTAGGEHIWDVLLGPAGYGAY